MRRILAHSGQGHLVGAERTLNWNAIDSFWTSPSFRSTEDDHRPGWTLIEAVGPCFVLYVANVFPALIQRGCKLLVHDHGIVADDQVRCITVTMKETDQLLLR